MSAFECAVRATIMPADAGSVAGTLRSAKPATVFLSHESAYGATELLANNGADNPTNNAAFTAAVCAA